MSRIRQEIPSDTKELEELQQWQIGLSGNIFSSIPRPNHVAITVLTKVTAGRPRHAHTNRDTYQNSSSMSNSRG
ncbi:uncharacterized protein QC761_0016360 [Podospora bellae-mahoneyi]|uniref:Uncharacterized protein n=1 Tax=Podospora bellae-mahoneyi TaxID=2093777 RepID=A0ABR0FZR6_9PEZI|nr:hypothetical protein QC761_0016360 [Podospora bellae-mahoneyi]